MDHLSTGLQTVLGVIHQRLHSATHPVLRFEDPHIESGTDQIAARGQAGHARPEHQDVMGFGGLSTGPFHVGQRSPSSGKCGSLDKRSASDLCHDDAPLSGAECTTVPVAQQFHVLRSVAIQSLSSDAI